MPEFAQPVNVPDLAARYVAAGIQPLASVFRSGPSRQLLTGQPTHCLMRQWVWMPGAAAGSRPRDSGGPVGHAESVDAGRGQEAVDGHVLTAGPPRRVTRGAIAELMR